MQTQPVNDLPTDLHDGFWFCSLDPCPIFEPILFPPSYSWLTAAHLQDVLMFGGSHSHHSEATRNHHCLPAAHKTNYCTFVLGQKIHLFWSRPPHLLPRWNRRIISLHRANLCLRRPVATQDIEGIHTLKSSSSAHARAAQNNLLHLSTIPDIFLN